MPHHRDDLEPADPQRLADDLASLYVPPQASVPARIDDAIRNRARAHLAKSRRGRTLLRWAGAAAAVAAAACIVLVLRVTLFKPQSMPTLTQVVPPARVTIVDALKLAHDVQRGAGRDVNGDGRIDQADIDAVASAVVRLDDPQTGGVQ
jgi:hypothetical protein